MARDVSDDESYGAEPELDFYWPDLIYLDSTDALLLTDMFCTL